VTPQAGLFLSKARDLLKQAETMLRVELHRALPIRRGRAARLRRP
jgi:hypothetical protein